MKVVIVGGVAGGAGTATRLKRLCEDCEVIVIEKGEFVSFANCGLPYHIGGAIPRRGSLLLQTPESLKKRSGLEVRTLHEALAIDRDAKTVEVRDLRLGTNYEESYDVLVLATGSLPLMPPIEGIEALKTLTTIPEMDAILSSLEGGAKDVAVIGAGFIGLETAENLIGAGHRVHLVERMDQVLPPLDPEMAAYLQEELQKKGVSLLLGRSLEGLRRENGKLILSLGGETLTVDMAVLAAGVVPNSALAKQAGLSLNGRGGVIVNEFLQTSDPSIYAVGDVIETVNLALNLPATVPLAGPASRQGRLAAENILGGKRPYRGANPTAICRVFSLTAASTGASEKQLRGQKYHKVYVHPSNHPSYYPNAEMMHIKLLYGPEGVILGAQIVGGEGTDKRIDIFALAVRQKLTAADLSEQDFAYAPPFGSPRDPIHVAAFAALNQLEGLSHPAFGEDLKNAFLLDVREPAETSSMPANGACCIPLGELRSRLGELPAQREIIITCASGLRSYLAERILTQRGFKVRNFSGGFACLRIQQSKG